MDALYSSHNIEHLYAHEVLLALREFFRVLTPDGFVVITCSDLQSMAELVAQDKLTEKAYGSPAGSVTRWMCSAATVPRSPPATCSWLIAPAVHCAP